MANESNKKTLKWFRISAIVLGVIAVIGIAYAYFSYTKLSSNAQLITGNIYMYLNASDQIAINPVMPRSNELESDSIAFSITGTNESDDDLIYDISVIHGDDSTTNGAIRIRDEFVSFTLKREIYNEETQENEWVTIVDKESYPSFREAYRMYSETISANTTTVVTHNYKLYVFINNNLKVNDGLLTGTDEDYTLEQFNKLYASVKIKVTGDFNEKEYGVNFYKQIFDKNNNKGTSDTVVTFSERSGTDGKTGLYYMKDTVNDAYPIYYFRGNYQNNNVVFAGYCWKMVRTTDTGGIKMIYNGVYDATSKCVHATNTSETTGIGNSAFNSRYQSLAYMGYSYPNQITLQDGTKRAVYEWVENDTNILSRTEVVYGADVEYDTTTGKYKLTGGTVTGAPDDTHHYSLNSSDVDAIATTVRFYYYANKNTSETESDRKNYYIELIGGDKIDDAVRSMTEEPVDAYSTIQVKINSWYDSNIKAKYGDYLEDTIWCMDRSRRVNYNDGWYTTGSLTTNYHTQTYERASLSWSTGNTPKLTCDNDNDKLKYAYGHGNIGSKAALLTYDEVGLAGMTWYTNTTYSDNYLYTGYWYWLLSPAYFTGSDANASVGAVDPSGGASYHYVRYTGGGVRPVVSLKHGVQIFNLDEDGVDGTEAHPYIVGTNIS